MDLHYLLNVFRYIYNLLDFNDLDNFYASAKADLASPPETHWDSWSSTLVELVVTAGDNLTSIHSFIIVVSFSFELIIKIYIWEIRLRCIYL